MLEPLPSDHFTRDHAAHLLNRAGFGAPPAEIDRVHALGLQGAVDSLVRYDKIPETYADPAWSTPDPKEVAYARSLKDLPEEVKREGQRQIRLTYRLRELELHGWWVQRMRETPRPFQEKMTLFWHSLFATSVVKVKNPLLMWRQNQTFREQATGNWDSLLVAMGRDPAMLIWLDGTINHKDHPNENFAREVMELFTLGEGNYTEKDIKESARAFTGWQAERLLGQTIDRPRLHDDGEKEFLGQKGPFTGQDILHILAAAPRSSQYICERLWRYFGSEEPHPQLTGAMAARFQDGKREFQPLLTTLFMSREFYDPSVIRQQIKGPVQWLVGSCRVLERPLPPMPYSYQMMRLLGQTLFSPPSVKGWDTGVSWISTNTLLDRYNFAALLVQGQPLGLNGARGLQGEEMKLKEAAAAMVTASTAPAPAAPLAPVASVPPAAPADPTMAAAPAPAAAAPMAAAAPAPHLPPLNVPAVDIDRLFTARDLADPDSFIAALERRLIQGQLGDARRQNLHQYLQDQKGPLQAEQARGAIRLLMSTPDFQLT